MRAADDAGIAADTVVTSRAEDVAAADRVILPGCRCLRRLQGRAGRGAGHDRCAHRGWSSPKGRPFFGICVGMQLMATRGLEFATTPGLDWIAGDVTPSRQEDPELKIPHMGWNTLSLSSTRIPLLDGIELGRDDGLHAYFVHSYHMQPADRGMVIAETDHGGAVTAMVGRDNLIGTQFHPEKSQTLGLRLLTNFLRWRV